MARGMGGMNNMQGLIQQAQKMQKDMEKEQKALETTIFEAADTNNLVKVKMNGKKQLVELKVDPTLVDPEDTEMLEDLVLTTINTALAQVDEASQQRMGKVTQGMNLPF